MAKSPPAFQFYASDFKNATESWEADEVGVYIRLLCHHWTNGSLPGEPKKLSRIAGVSPKDFNRIFEVVGQKFESNGYGILINRRLVETRESQIRHAEARAKNGKLGGRPKKPKPNLDET